MSTFLERLRSNAILVSDGATGSNLQARGLAAGTPSEQWVMTNPAEIVRLHRDFIAAGADVILTSTFGGTSFRLEHCGLQDQVAEVNRRAVALAREAIAGRNVLVAGSIGPTGQLLEPLGPLAYAEAVAAFAAQARAITEAGADVLVIETQFDFGEAGAAIEGARSVSQLPIVCSFSFDMGAHTMMGISPAQAARELTQRGVDVIGINCGRSLDENLDALKAARAATDKPLWMKPNAGLPRMGDDDVALYDVTPETLRAAARQWIEAGASIIGGCCGTSPEHLKAIASAAK